MARKPAAATRESFADPVWSDDITVGPAAGDDHLFGARGAHDERIPALARLPAKNSGAQPHAAWRRIDQYRDDKRLRDLMREVYDE